MNEPFDKVEKRVGNWFQKNGYLVDYPEIGHEGYDIIVKKDGKRIAVQVKDHLKKITEATVRGYSNFAEKNSNAFDEFYFVVNLKRMNESNEDLEKTILNKGYSGTIFTNLNDGLYCEKLKLFLFCEHENLKPVEYLTYVKTKEEQILVIEKIARPEILQPIKIAVCTLKGGVGKTTTAVHIAGAFTLKKVDVALIDANPPQYSLVKLLDPNVLEVGEGDGIVINGATKSITCYTQEYFKKAYKENGNKAEEPIVIFDCAPQIEGNDPWIFKECDICLIPINLSPLGLSKGLEKQGNKGKGVLQNTIESIRKINPQIKFVVFENNRINSKTYLKLINQMADEVKKETDQLDAIYLDAYIRHSMILHFWGKESRHLAQEAKGANSHHPREDFDNLVDGLLEIKMEVSDINERLKPKSMKNILELLQTKSLTKLSR